MGYELLVKTIILLALTVKIVFASTDTKTIDKLIKEIKKERIGLSEKSIKNPFESHTKNSLKKEQRGSIAKKVKSKKRDFRLNAIINNRVKIDNKWYKIDSKIDNYNITILPNQCIELKDGNDKREICIKKTYKRLFSTYKER